MQPLVLVMVVMLVALVVPQEVGLGGVVLVFELDKMFQCSEEYWSGNSMLVLENLVKQKGSQEEEASCSNT